MHALCICMCVCYRGFEGLKRWCVPVSVLWYGCGLVYEYGLCAVYICVQGVGVCVA